MPTLTPVDNDPFAVSPGPKLTPVDHDPFAPAPTGGSSYDPTWKPTGHALWDLMTRPIAKTEGPVEAARDYGSSALDAATLGWGQRMGLQDPNTVAQANANLGPIMGPIAQASGYAVGPGKILGPIAGGIAGTGVKGLALEGAAAGSIAGAAKEKNNPLAGAGVGAVGGGALGTAGGLLGQLASAAVRGPANAVSKSLGLLSDPAEVTASTKAASDAAFQPMKQVQFDPTHVRQAYTDGYQGLAPDQLADLSPGFNAKVKRHFDQIQSGRSVSADSINGYVRSLDDAARSNGDRVLAGKITDNLEGPQGVLATSPTLSGHAPGEAAAMDATAKSAFQRYANAKSLQEMSQNLKDFGTNPVGQARDIAQKFYSDPANSAYAKQRQALIDIAQSGGSGGQTAYNMLHIIDPALDFFGGAVAGGPGAVAGGVAGHMMKPSIGQALSASQRAAQQRAIGGAYPALTGAPKTVINPNVGQMLKSLMLGPAGSAGF